jgi:hypothetical protein
MVRIVPSDIRQVPDVPAAPDIRHDRLSRLGKLAELALLEECARTIADQAAEERGRSAAMAYTLGVNGLER